MDADRKVKIGFETTADTSGAEKAKDALDDVREAAGTAAAPLANPAPVKTLAQTEEAVQRLRNELRQLPVGSQEFLTMANRVKAAEREMDTLERQARKLAGTTGRSGNAGMAVLEFSRAIEDAQYGMRGVLNNIPGLIAMLGGGAGLAGVLSVAAVLGTQLWEVLGKNKDSEDAKANATDWLEVIRKINEELRKSGKLTEADSESARGESYAKTAREAEKIAAAKEREAAAQKDANKARIEADADVSTAQAKLDLARTEAALKIATGEKAAQLEKDREATLKRIVELERTKREELRREDERQARGKLDTADSTARGAGESKDAALSVAQGRAAEEKAMRDLLDKLREEREKTARTYEGIRDDLRRQADDANNPVDVFRLNEEANRYGKKAEETRANPTREEADAMLALEDTQKAAKQAADNFKSAAERQSDAAEKLKAAAEAFDRLKERNDIERGREDGVNARNDEADLTRRQSEAGQTTAADMGRILDALKTALGGAAAEAGNQTAMARVGELAKDGIQAGEQDEVVRLLGALVNKIKDSGEQSGKLMKQILDVVNGSVATQQGFAGQIDDIKRRLQTVEANIGK